MRGRDLRLVPVAAAAWAGAGAAVMLPQSARWVAVGLWAAALAFVALTARPRARRRTAQALVAVGLAVAAAAASHVALSEPARAAAAHLAIGGGRAIAVHAVVVGKADRTASGDAAFDARADEIDIGLRQVRVAVPVVIRARTQPDVGARVVASGTAFPAGAGERAVLVVRAGRGLEIVAPPRGVVAVAARLRHGLAAATGGLPQPAAGIGRAHV